MAEGKRRIESLVLVDEHDNLHPFQFVDYHVISESLYCILSYDDKLYRMKVININGQSILNEGIEINQTISANIVPYVDEKNYRVAGISYDANNEGDSLSCKIQVLSQDEKINIVDYLY